MLARSRVGHPLNYLFILQNRETKLWTRRYEADARKEIDESELRLVIISQQLVPEVRCFTGCPVKLLVYTCFTIEDFTANRRGH